MLVQFSVENFLSFDEEEIFSMVATADDQHPKHVAPNTPRKGEAVLRGAAIYGANGAGKSNLVEAIRFAQRLILEGTRGRHAIPSRPFRLAAPREDASSKFEFVIQTGGVLYNYGLRVDAARVREEWLFATPKTQEVLFFQRTTPEDGKVEVEFGPSFTGRSRKKKQFLNFVAQGTRPNQPFLTEAIERNVEECAPIAEWFRMALVIISAESAASNLEMSVQGDETLTTFLGTVLRSAGTGVGRVTAEEEPYDLDALKPMLTEQQRQELETNLQESEAVIVKLHGPQSERAILKQRADGQVVQVSLKMFHPGKDGQLVPFSMDEQSDGTRRLIHLTPALYMLKQNPEQTIIIDELDRRLHTLLSRLFVQAALDCDDEHRQSQLIFTTHDTNLLDLDLLRRDEIWFVEKDSGGASHLRSLVEYKIRPDFKAEKGYLSGRFGALPFFGDPGRLGLMCQTTEKTEDVLSETRAAA